MFSTGTVYTFGNMSPYIASYLKYRTNNSWVTNGDTVWILAITVFSKGCTMPLGGVLERFVGPRLTCLIGGITMSLGTIFTFFTIKHSIYLVILTYGFMYGAGMGVIYSVALATSVKWFPKHVGLVSGIVVGGYGLGSLLINLIQTTIINPHNNSPNITIVYDKYFTDAAVLDNVPSCFLMIGFLYAIMQIIGIMFLISSDEDALSSEKYRLIAESTNSELNISKIEESKDFTLKMALKEYRFYILWVTFLFNGIFIVTITSLYKNFGQTFINDDHFFSIVGSTAAIFNAGGRMVWGKLFDIFSYKKMMTALTFSMAFVLTLFYFSSLIKSVNGAKAMYTIWVFLLFFISSGNFSMIPAATSQNFGSKNLAILYGLIYFGYAISNLLGALVISILLHMIHYWGQFTVATLFALFSLSLTQFFPTSEK